MKTFSVIYDLTINHEAIVKAKNKKEAMKKVVEVIGDDVVITDSWEVKE